MAEVHRAEYMGGGVELTLTAPLCVHPTQKLSKLCPFGLIWGFHNTGTID